MGKSSTILLFAFGSAEHPQSGVWRISVARTGDVYVQMVREFGNEVHISLHASGKWSAKVGDHRHKLGYPQKFQFGWWGPNIIFASPARDLPVPPLSADPATVQWLGTPLTGNCMYLRFLYTQPGDGVKADGSDRIVVETEKAKLFHEPKRLTVICSQRAMTLEEVMISLHRQSLDFRGNPPDALEVVRISQFSDGPSSIIIEPYDVT